MGPVGASIGLGLRGACLAETEVVGADGDRDALGRASKIGAVDRATGSLRSALEGAQLVILATPLPDIKELLQAIGPILDKGCVVTDTGTAKVQTMAWAQSYLPRSTSFVGGRPLPRLRLTKLEDADASAFRDAYYCVIPADSAQPEAVKTVVGLVETLGAKPLFLDAQEHDSFVAAVAHLPLVLSSALVTSTMAGVSWREMSRLAGFEFRQMSRLASNDPQDSAAACLASRDALVRQLDHLVAELGAYRDRIEQGNDSLLETFVRAREQRAKWECDDPEEGPVVDVPSATQTMAGLVVGKRLAGRFRDIVSARKRPR